MSNGYHDYNSPGTIKKVLVVKTVIMCCKDCKHIEDYKQWDSCGKTTLTDNTIHNSNTIPSWCPLGDARKGVEHE